MEKISKISFETLFLIFSLLFAFTSKWSIASCIFAICASVLMLIDKVPKLWRHLKTAAKK